jgi:hypothetical protein
VITLRAPDGSSGRMTVLNRRRMDPRDVLALERLAGRNLSGQLVVAPFLSARARELLRDAGAGYADAAGNVRIALPKPGLFIEADGARKDPTREKRSLASLKDLPRAGSSGPCATYGPPDGVRHLSEVAQTPPASVSRVIALLQREALVDRDDRGSVVRRGLGKAASALGTGLPGALVQRAGHLPRSAWRECLPASRSHG